MTRHYLITAYDYPNSLAHQLSVRPAHLANMEKVDGCIIMAGGILNDQGQAIGSALVMKFESQEKLQAYLDSEPYLKEGVWEKVKVEPFNTVILNNEKVGS